LEEHPMDFRRLTQSLQQKHEQLILISEVASQLKQKAQRQSATITALRSQLTDSQFKIDALEAELQSNQDHVNHLSENQYEFEREKADLTDQLRDATDHMSDQQRTIELLRHTLQQQENLNISAIEKHFDDGEKHQEMLKDLRQKYTTVMAEKQRMKKERIKLNRRNTFLESFGVQMTVENLKMNKRVAQMDSKMEECTEEIERQNQVIEGLRTQNLELLDKISQIDTTDQDEEIKELLDQCIQVDESEDAGKNTVDIQETPLLDVEGKALTCCGGPEEEKEYEEEGEGEDLLTLIQQYEDHEDYLKQEEEEEDLEEKDEEDRETRNKENIIVKLVMEGIQREQELNQLKKSSALKRRGIWDFFTSRIESMRWI